jgi:hypothetical protein
MGNLDMKITEQKVPACPALTNEELHLATPLPRNKATGPDGGPNKILAVVTKKVPQTLISIIPTYLYESVFLTR